MPADSSFSRRGFVGGLATALGYLTLKPDGELLAHGASDALRIPLPPPGPVEDYDLAAKLGNNENPYGPPDSVMKAMTQAFKYSNRYGYPDGDIVEEIAKHHGVKAENVLLGAGSGEILTVVGRTYLGVGKKVVGVEPTYGSSNAQFRTRKRG